MRQLEHNHMLHPQILMHPLHTLRPLLILEDVIMLIKQFFHDVPLKTLQQVYLALHFFRVNIDSIRSPNISISLMTRSDIVKMPKGEPISNNNTLSRKSRQYIHFIRTHHTTRTIIEVHTNAPICKSITHSILIAVVNPASDKYFLLW